jgi:cytochrome c-type biogenesis protein CcmF
MVQERRGILRVWNVSLIAATFVLAVMGTFLVRSGILDSIHAFGERTLGKPFLVFIAAIVLGSAALILSRLPDLRGQARLDSLVSREAVFLLNNLVLVGLAFVIFWGTYFPLVAEAVTGEKQSVGPEWFNRYTTPLALVLVLLAGIGPVLAWRRVSLRGLRRAFRWPVVAAAAALALMLAATPAAESVTSLVMFTFVAFVLAVVVQEFVRGAGARRAVTRESWPRALGRLVARNRRRYGGYLVHAGIALLFLGVAASSAFVEQRDSRLRPGESVAVNGYTLTYREPTATVRDDRAGTGADVSLGAVVDVRRGEERFTLRPQRNYYGARGGGNPREPIRSFFDGESTSEVDVRWGLRRDLWNAVQPDLAAFEPLIRQADRRFAEDPGAQGAFIRDIVVPAYRESAPPAQFRTLVSPLVSWIWIGGAIAVLGATCALWPSPEARRRRVTSLYAARLGRELSRA